MPGDTCNNMHYALLETYFNPPTDYDSLRHTFPYVVSSCKWIQRTNTKIQKAWQVYNKKNTHMVILKQYYT